MCTTLEHVPSVGGGIWQNVPNPELKMFYYTPKRLNYPPNLCENNNIMKVTHPPPQFAVLKKVLVVVFKRMT